MLITESIDSRFVRRPPGSPRRSVVYAPPDPRSKCPCRGSSGSIAWRHDGLICSVSADPPLTTAQLIAIANSTAGR